MTIADAPQIDILSAESVTCRFGELTAVDDMSIALPRGAVSGLIGANGAGKTTLLNILSGAQRPRSGRVSLRGRDVTRHGAAFRARGGLARTFQHPKLAPTLTCVENVMLGDQSRHANGLQGLNLRRVEQEAAASAVQVLQFIELDESKWLTSPGELPPQDHRWIEIARALMGRPEVVLLDEPTSGFTRDETDKLVVLLNRICQKTGTSILLVTHDVTLAVEVCDNLTVMHRGKKIAAGPPAAIIDDDQVIAAYLGKKGRGIAVRALSEEG